MAFIDVVEWSPKDNSEYAHRFPHDNLSTGTQLIVRESQEAVFFSKGQILGKFGLGRHTLSTENLPLLRNLFGIPFGGKNPFFAVQCSFHRTAAAMFAATPLLKAVHSAIISASRTERYK